MVTAHPVPHPQKENPGEGDNAGAQTGRLRMGGSHPAALITEQQAVTDGSRFQDRRAPRD